MARSFETKVFVKLTCPVIVTRLILRSCCRHYLETMRSSTDTALDPEWCSFSLREPEGQLTLTQFSLTYPCFIGVPIGAVAPSRVGFFIRYWKFLVVCYIFRRPVQHDNAE